MAGADFESEAGESSPAEHCVVTRMASRVAALSWNPTMVQSFLCLTPVCFFSFFLLLSAQLSCYNWQGKEARALSRERTCRHGCTGRGRDPPTTPEFHQVRTSTRPNPTVKLVRKRVCSRLKRAEGSQTRPQPDTGGWKFPNGQSASPQSRLGGFHKERRLRQATSMHTQSWAP